VYLKNYLAVYGRHNVFLKAKMWLIFPFSSLSTLCLLSVTLLSWMPSHCSLGALMVGTDAREEFVLLYILVAVVIGRVRVVSYMAYRVMS
jgi:hypothetical protein